MASTIRELLKDQYDYRMTYVSYIDDFRKNPYTYIKVKFYLATSSALVYFLLKTRITPNTVTVFYALFGAIGGIFLAIPNNAAIFVGLFLFFTKGILDWADGYLARLKGLKTIRGHVLDVYGAYMGALGFQIGLGFYVAWRNEPYTTHLLVLTTLIPYLYATRLTAFADTTILKDILSGGLEIIPTQKKPPSNLRKYYQTIASYLDDRARTIDSISLLIIIELHSSLNLTWIFFLLMVVKQIIISVGSFYAVVQGVWVEKKVKGVVGRDVEE
jgi:hypothetical protein